MDSSNEIKLSEISIRLLDSIKALKLTAYKISKDIPVISEVKMSHIKKGRNEPSIEILSSYCDKYKVSLDWILKGEGEMIKTGSAFISDAKPITDMQYMNIPFVPIYAQAGYGRGFGDVSYIETLPTIPVIVDKKYRGKYRVFEVDGDSMDDDSKGSICDGDKILGREIKSEHWKNKLHIKDWYFVIVMINDGISVKQITAHEVSEGIIHCHSLNPLYEDFTVNLNEVAELFNVIKIVDRNTKI